MYHGVGLQTDPSENYSAFGEYRQGKLSGVAIIQTNSFVFQGEVQANYQEGVGTLALQ